MANQVKLHVGYIGKTREGKRVEATSKTFDGYYKCSDGVKRDEEGSAWGLPEEYDIIGPWTEDTVTEGSGCVMCDLDVCDTNKYETGVWYGWNGGDCQVHPETVVQVRLLDPDEEHGDMEEYAGCWDWDCSDRGAIIAFRIVTPYVEPEPKVEGTTLMFDPNVYTVWYDQQTKMVHVKRMIEADDQ